MQQSQHYVLSHCMFLKFTHVSRISFDWLPAGESAGLPVGGKKQQATQYDNLVFTIMHDIINQSPTQSEAPMGWDVLQSRRLSQRQPMKVDLLTVTATRQFYRYFQIFYNDCYKRRVALNNSLQKSKANFYRPENHQLMQSCLPFML